VEIYDTTIGWRFINPLLKAQYGVDSMPETGENVAQEFQVTREDQDSFAVRSQRRAARAQAEGVFDSRIVPIGIPDRKGSVRVDKDEHPRADTTLETLAKLKPRVLGLASAGVPPRIMGIGPVPAVGKLVERLGVKVSQFDAIELNEAFASQALACLRQLGVPDDAEHVNPNGGAIALGHPLGMSGARIAGEVALELSRRGGRLGLATMCVGVGQGVALAMERM
jgi:3-oxoadipyl-CoA thiolase